jgi:hypothetical protein
MRVALIAIVALLALNFVDEQFFGGFYTQMLAQMMVQIRQSLGV